MKGVPFSIIPLRPGAAQSLTVKKIDLLHQNPDAKPDVRSDRLGVTLERINRGIQVDAVFETADSRAVHAAARGHVGQTHPFLLAVFFNLPNSARSSMYSPWGTLSLALPAAFFAFLSSGLHIGFALSAIGGSG